MAERLDEDPNSSSQSLTCPLCLDVFEDATLLTCEHTFCRKCLQKYVDAHKDLDHMLCPLCRRSSTLVDTDRVSGLPANVAVNVLVDEYHSNHGGMNAILEYQPKCTSCELQGYAVSFCPACNYYMCTECHRGHQQMNSFFKGHQVLFMKDVMEGKVSISSISGKCSTHKHYDKELFCEDCNVYLCPKCFIVSHRKHNIKNQLDFVRELQQKVDGLVEHSKAEIRELKMNIKARRKEARIGEMDALNTGNRQRIKSITSLVTLVDNDRLRHLETDSLIAHSVFCDELDALLQESTAILENVPNCHVIKKVKLPNGISGMTRYTADSVVVTQWKDKCLDVVASNGTIKKLPNFPEFHYRDIAFQSTSNSSAVISTSKYSEVCLYTKDEQHGNNDRLQVTTMNIPLPSNKCHLKVSTCPSGEILVARGSDHVYIFQPDGTRRQTIATEVNNPKHAFPTKSGLIVTSSCNSSRSRVTVYDRNGNAGNSLEAAPPGKNGKHVEYLYPTVDTEDRVYVARAIRTTVTLTRYDIQAGLGLKKNAVYRELHLSNMKSDRCYLVSLSRNMLAFSSSNYLYFIKVDM